MTQVGVVNGCVVMPDSDRGCVVIVWEFIFLSYYIAVNADRAASLEEEVGEGCRSTLMIKGFNQVATKRTVIIAGEHDNFRMHSRSEENARSGNLWFIITAKLTLELLTVTNTSKVSAAFSGSSRVMKPYSICVSCCQPRGLSSP